jgi:hypothetical protein
MPTNGAVFQGIDTFQLAASAIDPGGSVVRVEFRVNGNAVGADATTPYTGSWRPSVTGSYTITAVATDNGGATTTSTPVQISVGPPPPPPNQPPSVSLTSPSNGSVLAAPAPLVLRATANDSDGSVTRVEFLLGTVIVGSDESEPYEVPWSQSTPGSYTFVARARDNAGAETSSVPATVTVVNPPTEVCGDGLDNDKDGQVDEGCPPPVPQAPVVSGGVSECRFVLSAGATGRTPPDSSGGWWAQFRVNGSIAGIDIDKAVPWQRTIRKAPGTYTWDIVWTKSGWTAAQARVSGATQTLVCGG